MYATLGDPPKKLARVALSRPDWRTVRVAFPKTLLRKRDLGRYRWNALSVVEGRHDLCDKSGGCFDWAPNPDDGRRYVEHFL